MLYSFRSLILLILALKYGIRTSPAQFFYFLATIVTGAPTLRSVIQRYLNNDGNGNDEFDAEATDHLFYLYVIQYGLYFILFILNCLADAEPIKYDERIKGTVLFLNVTY